MTDGIYLPQSKVSRMLLQQLADDGYCCNKNVSSDLSPRNLVPAERFELSNTCF